jgi:PAS domain S-box-containing protein
VEHDQGTTPASSDLEHASLASLPVDALVPAIDGLLFLVTRDGRILDFRAGTASEPFVPPQEFLGRPIDAVLPPEVADAILPALASVQPGEAPAVSYWLAMPDGPRAYEARLLPLANDLCLAFVNHVTDRVRAEHELRERTEMLRGILQAEPECVKVIDRDGRLVEINPAGLAILEAASLAEAQAQPLVDYLRPGQLDAWEALLEKVWAGGEGTLDVEIVGRRGTPRWLEINAVPLVGRDGEVGSFLGVSRDVTDRRAAEEALRKSERRLAEATTAGAIGVFDHDLVEGTIHWSPELRAIFGWDPHGDEVVTTDNVLAQIPEEDRSGFIEDLARFQDPAAGPVHLTERRMIRRDTGELRWILHRVRTTFEGEGDEQRPVRIVGAIVDITERYALEQRLAQVERLDSIGRLAGGIAHDFNNMLTAILGFAQLIGEDAAAGAPLNLDDLHQISAAAERARDMTAQLLAFARRQPSQPRPVNLNDEVVETKGLVGQLLREDIDLDLDLAPDLWPVHIDPGHVEQILMNLVLNAQDAMPDGGAIRVTTANMTADPELVRLLPGLSPGPYVRLRVVDEGVGIEPELLPRVFEPFFTTKAVGDGTGLGLATVHGIVRQNDGDVAVRSRPGEGSTFDVYLPRATGASPEAVEADAAPDVSAGSETLLVVEDDASVRSLTARLLGDAGYRVHVAASPAEAIALARSADEDIDLLVTDVVMPQMSGRALADVLRSMRPRLRVLFVSGYADTEFAHEDVEERLDFLPKPFTPAALRTRVRDLLDSPR